MKKRLFKSKEPVACLLCQLVITRSENLSKHLVRKHFDFLVLRSIELKVTKDQAVSDTVDEHVTTLHGIREELLEKYGKYAVKKIPSQTIPTDLDAAKERRSEQRNMNDMCKEVDNIFSKVKMHNTKSIKSLSRTLSSFESEVNERADDGEEVNERADDGEEVNERADDGEEVNERAYDGINSVMLKELGQQNAVPTESSKPVPIVQIPIESILDLEGEISSSKIMDNSEANKRSFLQVPNVVKGRHRQLSPSCECVACIKITDAFMLFTNIFKQFAKSYIKLYCKCERKDSCCCKHKLDVLKVGDMENLEESDTRKSKIDDSEHFFPRRVTSSGGSEVRHYCFLCHRHTMEPKYPSKGGMDWVISGVRFDDQWKLRRAMTNHLKSKQHQKSVKQDNERMASTCNAGLPKDELASRTTENLCRAGQFMAEHNLPTRIYPSLVSFIRLILENVFPTTDVIHPLGNRHHTKMAVWEAQIACYESLLESKRKRNNKALMATGTKPRFMVSVDKGTALKDGTRQVIIATHINSKGLPQEDLISAACIADATAKGATQHLKENLLLMLNTKQVAVLSTYGASVYVGSEKIMLAQMTSDEQFSPKIIYLPDLCHKVEQLMFHTNPSWVIETLTQTVGIVNSINLHADISNTLTNYAQIHPNLKLYAFQSMSKTSYTEYGHIHLRSILKNLEIVCEALPSLIEDKKCDGATRNVAIGILKQIGDRSFLAKMILIEKVFIDIAEMEKAAQGESFGPFDYMRVISHFKSKLNLKLEEDLEKFNPLLSEGKLDIELKTGKKIHRVNLDLNDVHCLVSQPARRMMDFDDIKTSYKDWVTNILQDFDQYLGVPEVMERSSNVFSFESQLSFSEKVAQFRLLLNSFNIEFLKCRKSCRGILHCDCITKELEAFLCEMKVVKENTLFKHSDDEQLMRKNEYSRIFAYFLADNLLPKSKRERMVNVIRAVEIIQLMKASQSCTERAMSNVANTLKGRFENICRRRKKRKVDMVNVSAFLLQNSSYKSMDVKLPRIKFLQKGHPEALCKTKTVFGKSSTEKRVLEGTEVSSHKRRRIEPAKNCRVDSNNFALIRQNVYRTGHGE